MDIKVQLKLVAELRIEMIQFMISSGGIKMKRVSYLLNHRVIRNIAAVSAEVTSMSYREDKYENSHSNNAFIIY
jgi:hypothetical protein